jgi:HEAT repeat protein
MPHSGFMDECGVTAHTHFSAGIPQIVQLLRSDNEEVREAAALALANLTTSSPANAK